MPAVTDSAMHQLSTPICPLVPIKRAELTRGLVVACVCIAPL